MYRRTHGASIDGLFVPWQLANRFCIDETTKGIPAEDDCRPKRLKNAANYEMHIQ